MSDRVQALKEELNIILDNFLLFSNGKHELFVKGVMTWEEEGAELKKITAETIWQIISFLVSQRLGWAEKLEFPKRSYQSRYASDMTRQDIREAGAVKFVPLEIND